MEAAANAGASITQVGDDHQLNPVGPGGLWTIFHGLAQKQSAAVELLDHCGGLHEPDVLVRALES